MLFMVIESFEQHDMIPVLRRARDHGRQLPDGLEYVDSWIEANFGRCFQLMRTDDASKFQEWVLAWRGAGVSFEIIPVVPSSETAATARQFIEREKEADGADL
jgi:Protein of unknown function (DUF3303)